MNWDQIYQDMAFNPYKGDMADYNNLKDALVTLFNYMQGQSKDYEVYDALGYLEQRFGAGVLMGCSRFRAAMELEDETARDQVCYEGISLIESYLRRNQSARTV
jgi:hypothetical protein